MFYRIAEVSTARAAGHTYVLVEFWRTKADHDAGAPPVLVNDFLMQLRAMGRRIVARADGWLKLTDGRYVDPEDPATAAIPRDQFEREDFLRPAAAEIRGNIEAYWRRAVANEWTGDHTGDASRPFYVQGVPQAQGHVIIARDLSDPHGLLARPEVAALRDAAFEVVTP